MRWGRMEMIEDYHCQNTDEILVVDPALDMESEKKEDSY